jgi:hypothetical protein
MHLLFVMMVELFYITFRTNIKVPTLGTPEPLLSCLITVTTTIACNMRASVIIFSVRICFLSIQYMYNITAHTSGSENEVFTLYNMLIFWQVDHFNLNILTCLNIWHNLQPCKHTNISKTYNMSLTTYFSFQWVCIIHRVSLVNDTYYLQSLKYESANTPVVIKPWDL